MQRKFLFTAMALICIITASAQYKTVVYDHEKNFFNEGQALPYESFIMVNGHVPEYIELLDISVFKPGALDKAPFVSATWKKSNKNQNTFNLPVNYKLKQNSEYDFLIRYFYTITREEKTDLYNNLSLAVMSYIDQTVLIKGNRIELSKTPKATLNSLNEIVVSGLYFYRNDLSFDFPGFSDVVKEKIDELNNFDLKDHKFYNLGSKKQDEDYDKKDENHKFYEKRIDEFKKLASAELINYVNTIQYILSENKVISNYSTEKGQYVLPVNLGYGGIYNSGDLKSLSYGSSAYAGLSFPLGNTALNNSLLSNSSVSFGFYLSGFEDENGEDVTGPFVDKPLFLGLGTRAFKLFRVNAGVAALQKESVGPGIDLNEIYLRPSINLSFEIGLWLGLLK